MGKTNRILSLMICIILIIGVINIGHTVIVYIFLAGSEHTTVGNTSSAEIAQGVGYTTVGNISSVDRDQLLKEFNCPDRCNIVTAGYSKYFEDRQFQLVLGKFNSLKDIYPILIKSIEEEKLSFDASDIKTFYNKNKEKFSDDMWIVNGMDYIYSEYTDIENNRYNGYAILEKSKKYYLLLYKNYISYEDTGDILYKNK